MRKTLLLQKRQNRLFWGHSSTKLGGRTFAPSSPSTTIAFTMSQSTTQEYGPSCWRAKLYYFKRGGRGRLKATPLQIWIEEPQLHHHPQPQQRLRHPKVPHKKMGRVVDVQNLVIAKEAKRLSQGRSSTKLDRRSLAISPWATTTFATSHHKRPHEKIAPTPNAQNFAIREESKRGHLDAKYTAGSTQRWYNIAHSFLHDPKNSNLKYTPSGSLGPTPTHS